MGPTFRIDWDHYLARSPSAPGNRQPFRGSARAGALVLALSLCCGACSAGKAPETPLPTGGDAPLRLRAADVERQIAKGLAEQAGGRFTVTCPDRIPAQADYRFTCTAREGDTTVTVSVTEEDDAGAYSWKVQGGVTSKELS